MSKEAIVTAFARRPSAGMCLCPRVCLRVCLRVCSRRGSSPNRWEQSGGDESRAAEGGSSATQRRVRLASRDHRIRPQQKTYEKPYHNCDVIVVVESSSYVCCVSKINRLVLKQDFLSACLQKRFTVTSRNSKCV